MTRPLTTRPPWHLWLIGGIALLWHLAAAFDYVAAQYGLAPYLQILSEAQRADLAAMPGWAVGAWAIAVWGGLLASVLLLTRAAYAPIVFFVAAAALVVLLVWSVFLADPTIQERLGQLSAWLLAINAAVLLALWLYARGLHRRGVIA